MERKKLTVNQRLQVLSELTNRASLAASMGMQYGTDRDIYQALGYPTDIAYSDYAAKYERQDMAKAIINRPISYTWKGPLVLTEVGDDKETPFEDAWKVLEKDLKLKSKFVRLDKLSCIGGYGVLLLGLNDISKKEDWANPVEGNKLELLYVKPLGEGSAVIAEYENRTANKRYGRPKMYTVQLKKPGDNSSVVLRVHYSRLLHVTGELLESEVEGVPALQSVYNRLMDLEKLVGGSAEMFWRGARPGYQGKVEKDFQMTTTVEEDLQDQLDEYENNLRRILMTEGVDLNTLDSQVSDPKGHVDVQIQMISAVTGIPQRILTGSERGELASSQDRDSWFDSIQTRREEHAAANIIQPFVEMCIEYGVLPEPTTEEWQVGWLDLYAASEKDKAEVGKTRATALKEYVQNPMAEVIVPPDAFFELFLGLDQDQIELIKEMADAALQEEQRSIAAGEIEPIVEPIETPPAQ